MALRQAQRVGMAGGEAGDVQRGAGEAHRLDGLSLGEEPVGDAALVEDLDRPRVEPAGPGADQVGGRAPLEDLDSTPASASSPASIRPVGPAPTMVTSLTSPMSFVSHRDDQCQLAVRRRARVGHAVSPEWLTQRLLGHGAVTPRSPAGHAAIAADTK